METNGISLNKKQEEKKNDSKRSLFIGVLAGLALAAALGGAFMLGRGGEEAAARPSSAIGQTVGGDASDDNEDAASSNSGASNGGGAAGNGDVDEPTVAPGEPEDDPTDEPTATPTDEPTATPTATPTPDFECAFCPEGLDLGVEEPVVPPCGEDCVIDGGFAIDLPFLKFEETRVVWCEGFVAMTAEIDGNAEMWVEYMKDGAHMESAHTFGESIVEGETGTYFNGWGWIYPTDYVFHAEDAEGNHIEQEQILVDFC